MKEMCVASEVFPLRLKHAREARELSQSELAERARLQPSAISRFESGARKPSFDNLRRLAGALEVTTDYLLGRVDEIDSRTPETDELYRDMQNLTAEDRDLAREFLKVLSKRGKK